MSMHGLGQFHGELQAYADGVVGGPPGMADGALEAFKDGSLGEYFAASGPAMSGPHAGMGQEYFPGPDPDGARIAHAGMGRVPMDPCSMQIRSNCYRALPTDPERYANCVRFGYALCARAGRPGGRAAPTRGIGEYFAASGMRGLGAVATSPGALDLQDAPTLRELKTAMLVMLPQVSAAPGSPYNEAWLGSGYWGPESDALWGQIAQMLATATRVPPTVLAMSIARPEGGSALLPTAPGVQALILAFRSSKDYGEAYVAKNFPNLHSWSASPTTDVMSPHLSADEARGEGKMRLAKVLLWGAAGAFAIGIGIAVMKKRKGT